MAYPTPNLLGNKFPATGATEAERRALALTLSSGEILNVFEDPAINMFANLVKKFSISGGKELRVPVTGVVNAAFHNPGSEINVTTTNQTEITLTVNDIIYSAMQYPEIYDKLLDFNIRPEYTRKMGYALAQADTFGILTKIFTAAKTSAYIPGETQGGSRIISDKFKVATGGAASIAEKALAILSALAEAQVIFDEKFIPADQRYVALKPRDYSDLVMAIQSNGFSLSHKFYMDNPASINTGVLPRICGFQILKSPALPAGVDASSGGKGADTNPNEYFAKGTVAFHTRDQVDCRKLFGLIWHPNAVARLNLMGLQMKGEYQIKELSDLVVAYMCVGYNVYDPTCAISLELENLNY